MEEAVKYLTLAAKINPGNARVWLWLAASVERLEQKRECLETALQVAPGLLPARVLLDRLNGQAETIQQHSDDFVIFTCPNCGGKQRFDPDLAGLVCDYCKQIERLQLTNAAQNESNLEVALIGKSDNWALLNSEVACGACGAKLSIPSDQSTATCPFCDSDQIALQPASPELISPTAIIPFELHTDDVMQILEKKGFPVQRSKRGLKLTPIYLPFWTFDGRVQIRCALAHRVPAQVFSEHDQVLILETWLGDKSWYECDIDDLLIYAGRGETSNLIPKIYPFDLKSALDYHPEMLAGWQAELYQVALKDAAAEALQKMRSQAFRSAGRRRLFMRESDMLMDDVRVLDRTYKLVLLPVWLVRYMLRGKVYRALINGQTGIIAGKNKVGWNFLG
jgi:predicted RNA-binding Zn-ribbon protein involved in translation (DUF1610 family)